MSWRVGYFVRANEDVYRVIRAALPSDCNLVTLRQGDNPVDAVADIHFLIAGSVSGKMIEAAPELKLIMTPGVGYDGVDLAAASRRSLPVASTICGNATEVAEHTLMLMLAVSRRLIELDSSLRQGNWMMWDRRLSCFNLAGKTLGLIGYGRIGQQVARRAVAFDMNVIHHDPASPNSVSLDELLEASDFVSLHVPLTSATRRLLNKERLGRMKPGSVLINTSRGEIVEEQAVVEALQETRLAGAGFDVFEQEPPSRDNPLLGMSNVVVTPHVGSGTADGLRVKAQQYAENIRRVLEGQPPIDQVSFLETHTN